MSSTTGIKRNSDIPVVILCGGKGTRLSEETDVTPKPLVSVGGRPIIWHIMKIYEAHGFTNFILPIGYKGEKIKEYFENTAHPWRVTTIDTGLLTDTAGRLYRVAPHISGDLFMMTYGDGVADVDIRDLYAFHNTHDRPVTMTGVHPPARFGYFVTEGDSVIEFREKARIDTERINGGFFVLHKDIFSYFSDAEDLNFEKDILPRLAADRNLALFRHDGYWQCMDTRRDMEYLNREWESGNASWKVWADEH